MLLARSARKEVYGLLGGSHELRRGTRIWQDHETSTLGVRDFGSTMGGIGSCNAALPSLPKTRQARDLFPFWQAGQEHEHVREKYSCAGMMELSTQGAVTASVEI